MSENTENAVEEEEGNFFAITEETVTDEEGQGGIPSPGVHHNVILKAIKYRIPTEEETKKAKWQESLDFIFEVRAKNNDRDDKGNIITNPKGGEIVISRVGDTITHREFYSKSSTDKKKNENMMKRIKHIMVKFMPASEASVEGKSFKDLCTAIIKKLEGKFEGKAVKLKVIANISNGKSYSTIPYYMPFIENQEKAPTSLKLSAKEKEGDKPTNLASLDMGAADIEIPAI